MPPCPLRPIARVRARSKPPHALTRPATRATHPRAEKRPWAVDRVAAGPAAARRLARSARTSDKAAAELLKAVDKIQQRGLGSTSASEVAEERMLQKRNAASFVK